MPISFEQAENLINDLPKFTTKHSIEESKAFLDLLGNPGKDRHIIHVAGTNGKGSVCVYMESILMHAKIKTGCFVSPHLYDIRERFRIDGQMCSKEDFADACEQVLNVAKKSFYPTFFEFLFFVGLLIFDKHKVDILILETGLGGRLDATNLLPQKEICVIPSIGLDHMQYLGDTIPQIAVEKAGIMRSDVPVVYWLSDDNNQDSVTAEPDATLHRCASKIGAIEYPLSKDMVSDISMTKDSIDFCLRNKYDSFNCLSVSSIARYQIYNAALAVCSLQIWDTDKTLNHEDYIEGIHDAFWEGRMEEVLPEVYIDGAHNVPAIKAFLETVLEDGFSKRVLVFGAMQDKQYAEEIDLLVESELFDTIYSVGIASDRAATARDICDRFKQAVDAYNKQKREVYSPTIQCVDYTGDNINNIYNTCIKPYEGIDDNRVYIIGSLYLIGDIRGFIHDRF